MNRLVNRLGLALLSSLTLFFTAASAEEGFWLYTAPPLAAMKQGHGFAPSRALLDHLMRSAARFDSGGNSGAFVSADGLWLTNWHIGRAFIRRLEAGDRIFKEGFYAERPEQEIRLPEKSGPTTIRLSTVDAIEDVTARVTAVGAGTERDELIAEIEKEAAGENRRGQVIKLFGGARYQLLRLKLYTDIRLVFAPEDRIGLFDDNGDGLPPEHPDSFNLDACILRIYENGKPIKPRHFLAWAPEPVKAGDLVMGSGSPGASWRNRPMARFAFERDVAQPLAAEMQQRLGLGLADLARGDRMTGERLARQIDKQDEDRRYAGFRLAEYQDAALLAAPAATEQAVRSRVPEAASAYARLEAALRELAPLYPRDFLLNQQAGFRSELLASALKIVRRPPGTPDFGASEAEQKSDPALERVRLKAWLDMLVARLGYEDPVVQAALAGMSPLARAADIVTRTPVTSNDPLLTLARAIDAEAQATRTKFNALMDTIDDAEDAIERARYAAFKDSTAPEATNTLRFTYGTVAGYREEGKEVPAISTIGDLYRYMDRQRRRDPLTLPQRWIDGRARLNPATQLNFATTVDVVGGSSGTPIVNRKGQFVGVLNSGNFGHAASNDFFNGATGRSGGVSAAAIIEALRKVYGAQALANELVNGRR